MLQAPNLDLNDAPTTRRATTVAKARSTVAEPRPQRHSEYVHLIALFDERARLPRNDPRHRLLRDRLIKGHLPVARHIARKHASRGGDPDDLEQVATIGLILSVDRFEPARGVDFLSFAVPTITGEVLRYFRDRQPLIRMPRQLRELQAGLAEATTELSQALGRAPRPSEIAAHLGVDRATVLDALEAIHTVHVSSLDEPASAEGQPGGSGGPNRFDAALAVDDTDTDLVEHRATLVPLLTALPDRDRRILLLRFVHGLTQTEIGQRIGISQMHVSRLLAGILARLREQLAGGKRKD